MLVEIKLMLKALVTNSNFLSAIRRKYRYMKATSRFKKMQKSYLLSVYPEKIREYKNTCKGKACFIIGNGPSLSAKDLSIIHKRNIDSFAANRIYLMYEKTNWRPTYYMCQDRQLIQTLDDYYKSCAEKVLLGYQAIYEYGIDVTNAIYFLCDNRDCNRLVEKLDFSEDVDKYIIDGASVLYSAIQMAVYMGYSEIYLLGVDHSFSHTLDKNRRIIEHKEVKEDYFDKRYKEAFNKFQEKGKIYAAPDKDMIDIAFKAAKKYCDSHGIIIRNATRGGKLEIFERIDFDKIWEKENENCSNSTNEIE